MDKKKIISIIVAIVVLALAAGGFAGYWINRPAYKVDKAIEANDIETVAAYYGQLKEADKATTTEKMRIHCQDLSAAYTDGTVEYETVKAEYDLLQSEVLKADETFANIAESVEMLHSSRESYKAAQEAFAAKDYEKALDQFEKVIPSDENYKDAIANIDLCKQALLPDVVGTWMNSTDIGPMLATMLGRAGDERLKLEVITYYEFKEDGSGIKYADTEQMKKSFEDYMTVMIEIIVEQYQTQYGISREQLDKEFKAQYGMNMADYLRKYSGVDTIMESMEYAELEFTYTVDDKDVVATGADGRDISFAREGEELLLYSDVAEENTQILEMYQIEYPMHFTKVE